MNKLARVKQVMAEPKEELQSSSPSSMIWSPVYKTVCHTVINVLWIIHRVAQGTKGHGHILELNILRIYLFFCFVAAPIDHTHKWTGNIWVTIKLIFILMYFCKYRYFKIQQNWSKMSFHKFFFLFSSYNILSFSSIIEYIQVCLYFH